MELKETVKMMESTDYKEIFKAEYLQLKIRMSGLSNMLKKYKEGTLTFKPSCSYDLKMIGAPIRIEEFLFVRK